MNKINDFLDNIARPFSGLGEYSFILWRSSINESFRYYSNL